jgi:hypothetical protein
LKIRKRIYRRLIYLEDEITGFNSKLIGQAFIPDINNTDSLGSALPSVWAGVSFLPGLLCQVNYKNIPPHGRGETFLL